MSSLATVATVNTNPPGDRYNDDSQKVAPQADPQCQKPHPTI